jgi:hypothetical protein
MKTPEALPNTSPDRADTLSRRGFLKTVGLLPAAAAAAVPLGQEPAAAPVSADALPQVPFGRHTISRLVCGANPFNAGSHLSTFVNRAMREYYTPEQVLKTLRRCQEVGVNLWQSSGNDAQLYQRFIREGGQMQYISLASNPADIAGLAKAGCIGIAHHGEVTDQFFKAGKLDAIHEFVQRVHEAGLLAGVSTHMPDVVDAIESKGWELDFFMTCVYERHRSAQALEKLLGHVPLPVGEVYLQSDPPRMFKVIRQTKRTCLAFKILAAGRLSEQSYLIERAFRETFEGIKPGDAVIVGIYDRYGDQPAQNAEFVRRFGLLQS